MDQKSNNPFFKNKEFSSNQNSTTYYNVDGTRANVIDYNDTMTVKGAINKALLMFLLLLCGAATAWFMPYAGYSPLIPMLTGSIIGSILVLITRFSTKAARYTAPAYALFEGLFIGGVSFYFNLKWPGIVMQAVAGTMVTFGVCLALYRFGMVKVTQQFRSVVMAAVFAIMTLYLISWILSMFGITTFIAGTSAYSIGFSVFVIIIAALKLFLDFDNVEQGAKRHLPKHMEWYCAMGLTITLIWLYVEILMLLAKLNSRD